MSAHPHPAAVDPRTGSSGSEERPSMRDLLASCAAADAVSTPPPPPAAARQPAEPDDSDGPGEERDAA
ncbi:hypothetical protein [Streptomyces caatingaensis]|uniref:Uncharacterized protein n=1 Tax=Streptomyces caatingaensis TaxID=1678637 RepID=A0A0K9XAG4_9ACTN|nr:hypothetical protein [Streptomyces caatingaensis]KNB50173.1 hypothetical protein AC230_26135 [Streptomyces caatingaensis]